MDRETLGAALTKCFYCGKDDKIIMNRRLNARQAEITKEMHGKIADYEPCPECQEHMKNGIILMTIDPKKTTDMKNPWRTGYFMVVSDDFVQRVFTPQEVVDDILKARATYIDHDAAEKMGLLELVEQN